MRENGLQAIVVGGTAVAIYARGAEPSLDVDFVVQGTRLDAIDCLRELGLEPGKSVGVLWYSASHHSGEQEMTPYRRTKYVKSAPR